MATKVSIGTGNFTTAGTWSVCSAVANAELDSEASNVTVGTSNIDSSTFTLENGSVDVTKRVIGIAIKVLANSASTGTLSVILRNSTLSTDVATVTVNIPDITSALGWLVFSFGAVTADGATVYLVRLVRSAATGALSVAASTASASNIARQILLNTNTAPASGDKLIIAGAFTGAGANSTYTVTMDETATTSYGPTVSGGPPQGITVNNKSVLSYGVAVATNYYLKYKGLLQVYFGGTLSIGTSGAPIPSDSTAVLEMDSVANVDTGLNIATGAIFNVYGNVKWPTSAITGASNATPIEITSTSHGLSANERITIAGVLGNTAANGTWEVIASTGANTFTIGQINGAVGGGVGTTTGNGAYTSGGTWTRLAYTRLAADEAAAQTVIGPLLSTAGWANSDELAFASTTRTAGQCEKKTITSVDSATQVTLSAGLTNAHSGTYPTQCEVANLTRNIKVRGMSVSLQGYVAGQGTFTLSYGEFTFLGSVTAGKRGVETTGTATITYCSFHDSTFVSSVSYQAGGGTPTFSNNVIYNGITGISILVACTMDANCVMLVTGNGVSYSSLSGTVTNTVIVGPSTGVTFGAGGTLIGSFSGNTIHSCSTFGISFGINVTGSVSYTSVWRCSNTGIILSAGSTPGATSFTFDTLHLFGNTTNQLSVTGDCANVTIKNLTCSGDSTFATTSGLSFSGTNSVGANFVIESSTFGVASGILTAHTNDVILAGTTNVSMTFINCLMASATEISSQTSMTAGSFIRSQKHDQTVGNHKAWYRYGTVNIDTSFFDIVSPSVRLTPNDASNKLGIDGTSLDKNGSFFVPVLNGNMTTVSVKVRQSVAGDGTVYNGNLPRLIVRRHLTAGITVDTVLATATAASSGAWEKIQGTTIPVTDDSILQFIVDCDGTTGWVNVDSWDSKGVFSSGKCWIDGHPFDFPRNVLTVGCRGGFVN